MVNFVTFCPIIILTSIFNQLNQLWLKKYNKHAYLGHFFVQQNIINWTFFDKLGHSYQLNTNPSCNSTNTSVKILHLITHWRVLSNLTYKIDSFFIFDFSCNYFFSQNKLHNKHYRIPKSMPTQLSQCIKLHLNICLSAIWDTVTCTHPWFSKLS